MTLGQISFLLVNLFVFLGGVDDVDDGVDERIVKDVDDDDSEEQKGEVGVPFQLA